jgi:glutaminyl-peptide cyclotransferase
MAGDRPPRAHRRLGAALVGAVVLVLLLTVRGDPTGPYAAAREGAFAAQLQTARRVDLDVPRAETRRFDAVRALRLVQLQLRQGPRPSGSAALARTRRLLLQRLPRGRSEPVAGHPGLHNLVGTIPGRGPAIVLAAHYDTQREPAGFYGANDSAAGTAVVLEAARALARVPRPRGAREVRFVLLDGEELPADGRPERFATGGLRGSRAYAAAHARELGAVVVADYVAGRGLRLPREPGSDPVLWRRVRAAAERVGVGQVFAGTGRTAIIDDHVPFRDAGVPAVDLIDWEYPHKNTVDDTFERLSERAIDATGETVVAWLEAERRR